MKEGRMKGQAFVTFQDEELAEEALEEVNGFKLYDKPMIIVCLFLFFSFFILYFIFSDFFDFYIC